MSLLAWHWYCPASLGDTPSIIKLSLAKMLMCLGFPGSNNSPSFSQVMTGVGFPVAVQFHTKVEPASVSESSGVRTNSFKMKSKSINMFRWRNSNWLKENYIKRLMAEKLKKGRKQKKSPSLVARQHVNRTFLIILHFVYVLGFPAWATLGSSPARSKDRRKQEMNELKLMAFYPRLHLSDVNNLSSETLIWNY